MYPILLSSLLALAVVLERTIYFVRSIESPEKVLKKAEDIASGTGPCPPKGRGGFSHLLYTYCIAADAPEAVLEEILHREGSRVVRGMERGLGLLSAIAHLTPLMGLFGTVLGMIGVFQGIERSGGSADMEVLAGGIWIALLTTAFGLMVALPAMGAHHLFDGLARRRAEGLQDFIGELNPVFGRKLVIDDSDSPDEEIDRSEIYETLHTG
jgi:biopolymer transport protein ExbB